MAPDTTPPPEAPYLLIMQADGKEYVCTLVRPGNSEDADWPVVARIPLRFQANCKEHSKTPRLRTLLGLLLSQDELHSTDEMLYEDLICGIVQDVLNGIRLQKPSM